MKFIFKITRSISFLKDSKNIILLIFIVSFLIRLIFSIFFMINRGILYETDASDYIQFAKCVLNQGWIVKNNLSLLGGEVVGPGYPYLIALNYIFFGTEQYYFLILLQSLFAAFTVVIIYKIALIFSNRKVAFLSAIWLSVYALYIWYTPLILKETLVFFLFSFSILLVIRIKSKSKSFTNEILFLVIVYSYLIHTDERYLIYLPLFIIYILLPLKYFKDRIFTVLFFLAGIALLMTPWLYRNYLVYQRPVLLTIRTTEITDRLFGYEPLWSRDKSYNYNTKQYQIRTESDWNISYYKSIVDSLQAGQQIKSTEEDVFGLNNIKNQVKLGNIPYPFNKARRFWSYFKAFWRPFNFKGNFYGNGYRYEAPWSLRLNLVSIFQYGILIPFFLYGIYVVFRNKNQTGIFLVIIIMIHSFIHTFLLWGLTRYRLPIDGLIIIIAFIGMSELYERFKYSKVKNKFSF